MSLRAATVVVVAGVVAVLGGCTSTSEPVVSPSVSVSAVVTPSPSPTLSHEEQMLALIPEEAKGDDLFAAEAMAKFFISLHPGLLQTGDTALWEFLCLPSSVFCSSTVESVRVYSERGERQVGGDIEPKDELPDLVLDVDTEPETALVGFGVIQSDIEIVDSFGQALRHQEAKEYRVAIALRHIGGLWRIYAVEIS